MFLILFQVLLLSVGKNSVGAIFVLNLLLGWSFISWVIALVWAISNKETNQQIVVKSGNPENYYSNIDQLIKLKELHEKGVITDQEFAIKKNKLLS